MAQTKAQLLGPVVGDVTIDASTLSLDAENNKVGIGTTEADLRLHVNGPNALPSSSGSTATGHLTLRDKAGSATHGMFMGVSDASPFGSWIQSQDSANNATNYPLLLNPNGGNIGIGTDNPISKICVGGTGNGSTGSVNLGDTAASASLFLKPDTGSAVGLALGGRDSGGQYIQAEYTASTVVSVRDLSINPYGGGVAIGVLATAFGGNPGADTILLGTSQIERLRIDSTGGRSKCGNSSRDRKSVV